MGTIERILGRREPADRALAALDQLCSHYAGEVRGMTVARRDEGYAFEAQVGYGPGLRTVPAVHGPWRNPGPRTITNVVQELFTPNAAEVRRALSDLGLRDAQVGLVVPVRGEFHDYGALLLLRHDTGSFTDADVERAATWGAILGAAVSRDAELRHAKLSLVEFSRAFVQAMEAQDFAQLGHGERVTAYALALGRALELPQSQLVDLYFAAMLHDIGKLGSGEPLASESHDHPTRGANLVASADLLAGAAHGIRAHHEAWDGSGFPAGLRKDEIPLLARIVAVADVFDMLSSERGEALPLNEVERGLEARSGQQLDPALVSLFINILRQGKSTQELATLGDDDLPF